MWPPCEVLDWYKKKKRFLWETQQKSLWLPNKKGDYRLKSDQI